MNGKSGRITTGILAVLAATVVACGSIQGAAGRADQQPAGGASYLTADDNYALGLAHGAINRDYPPQEQDVPEFLQAQTGAAADATSSNYARAGGYCVDDSCPRLQP